MVVVAASNAHVSYMRAGVPDTDWNAAFVSSRGQHCTDFIAGNLDTCNRLCSLHVFPSQHTPNSIQLEQKASEKRPFTVQLQTVSQQHCSPLLSCDA